MSTQDPMDYRTVTRTLRAEGHDIEDIDAAIDSLVTNTNITYEGEDELLLTDKEVEVLRAQLRDWADDADPVSESLMTTGQAADVLGVTRRTVTGWCEGSRIDAFQTPGGHWRIPASAVEAIRREMTGR